MAIIGPDGVGKSTVMAGLTDSLAIAFWRRHRRFHWRPNVIATKSDRGPVTNPHGKPVRGPLASMLCLSGFFLDYCAGYLLLFVTWPPNLTWCCLIDIFTTCSSTRSDTGTAVQDGSRRCSVGWFPNRISLFCGRGTKSILGENLSCRIRRSNGNATRIESFDSSTPKSRHCND